MEKSSGKKRAAVLVGCNYPNTPHELHGCINDVLGMREALVKELGFEGRHIELLTDAPGSSVMPTGANIKKAVDRMVDAAQSGDVLFFHYSGHGTTIPSSKPGHPFRQDEAIVPCDFNLITGLYFFIYFFLSISFSNMMSNIITINVILKDAIQLLYKWNDVGVKISLLINKSL